MASLRSLGLLLVLAVAVPTAVLAVLGLESTAGMVAMLDQRLDRELDQAARTLQALAVEAVAEAERGEAAFAQAVSETFARRLPADEPRSLFTLAQEAAARQPAPHADTMLAVSIVGPRGVVLPRTHDPDSIPVEPQGRLLADLRLTAERALAGGAGADAALAIWSSARGGLGALGLGDVVDVESAWIRARSVSAPLAEVQALRPRERALLRSPAARTWILLLLSAVATDASGSTAEMLQHVIGRGELDRIPLTREERAVVFRHARRMGWPARLPGWDSDEPLVVLFPSPTVPVYVGHASSTASLSVPVGVPEKRPRNAAARYDERLHAALPEGLTLEIDRREGAGLGLRIEALRRRWEALSPDARGWATWGLTSASPGEQRGRQVLVPLGRFGTPVLHLSHSQAPALRAEVASRRRWTAVGVASLVVVVALGLWLVQRALRREREAVKLRDDFLANVSHELRTPLTSVCLHADLLAEERVGDEQRRAHAEVVRAEGGRLAALVDDLLDVGALERGARRLDVGPVDLAAAVERAVAPLRVLAEGQGRALTLHRGVAGVALADPHALARILANLLRNALDHGAPARDGGPGRIDVVAETDVLGSWVEVRDDGPGIPAAERARLFERFRRGSTAKGTRGTGLGLALSRALARAMGGDLALEDDDTRTVFRLTLPPVPPDGVEGPEVGSRA